MDSFLPKYNCSLEAKAPAIDPRVGKKISIANKGRIVSEETRAKISASKMGHITTSQARKKMSKAKKGIALSEEHKLKLSNSLKGRIFGEDTRRRMSAARIGIKLSATTCRRISEAKKGVPQGRRSLAMRARMLAAGLRTDEKQLNKMICKIRSSLQHTNALETSRRLGIKYKTVLRVARNHATYCYIEEKYRG